jgi:hypothetical protein
METFTVNPRVRAAIDAVRERVHGDACASTKRSTFCTRRWTRTLSVITDEIMHPEFGWEYGPLGWHPVQSEQEVIKRALRLRAEGFSLRVAAAIMNDEGCTSRGGRIHATQIARWERRSRAE